jgi:hypothetical protein
VNDERQAFESWCTANGHGTLDDMVAPLDRSLRALMWSAWQAARAASPVPAPVEMTAEFTDTSRAALAWVLWHHQGASSEIGQAMRFALGMGRTDRMSERQVAEAKRWAALGAQPPTPQPPQGAQQEP